MLESVKCHGLLLALSAVCCTALNRLESVCRTVCPWYANSLLICQGKLFDGLWDPHEPKIIPFFIYWHHLIGLDQVDLFSAC